MTRILDWIGHHVLRRVVVLEGIVENVEPLRIGVGKGVALESVTELEVLKIYNPKLNQYIPTIPGSSWKGLFRSAATAILRTFNINVCDGLPRTSCRLDSKVLKGLSTDEKLRIILSGDQPLCLLCLVFGSAAFTSHVIFADSVVVSDYRLGYRSGIAIDRRTGSIRRGALYTVEYVEPGAKFTFRLDARNLPNYVLGLLAQVITDIDNGFIKVGGFKSRGFGTIKFVDLKIRVFQSRGVVVGKGILEPLDPIDSEVELTGELRKDLELLRQVFLNSLDKIRKISENGWKWDVLLSEIK
jgi:CRISPR-associated RAMP protein (TIGR02581 family)